MVAECQIIKCAVKLVKLSMDDDDKNEYKFWKAK